MRRTSLSTKLFAAALPLVVAIGTLLTFTVRTGLEEVSDAEQGADLGRVWSPLINTLNGISREQAQMQNVAAGLATGMSSAEAQGMLAASRLDTDNALVALDTAVQQTDLGEIADTYLGAAQDAIDEARGSTDLAMLLPETMNDGNPVRNYNSAMDELVSIGRILPAEAGTPELGRELLAVVSLADAALAATDIITATSRWPNATADRTPLLQADEAFDRLDIALDQFRVTAPDTWLEEFGRSGFDQRISQYSTDLDLLVANAGAGPVQTFDTLGFAQFVGQGVEFQTAVSEDIVTRATAEADAARRTTMIRLLIILGAVLVASLVTWWLTRSIARRIRAVADSANTVASEQLPALVEAIRDPRGKAVIPEVAPVDARGHDELAELAEAFNSMQGTLVDVAQQQVEVLRRGVSDIFVTMARRNRSLIDRQLAMLDEFEAEVDDPDVLANYYQLDHMATRMRRNSESLLVLANAEPKRRRVKATEIDDVVRAAIGEVEEYRRIEIEALESLQVRGNVVADISHLLAELLDNATSFSPPDSPVRVGGRRTGDSYMLRIVDDGVGIGTERMKELNALLREPPVVGLSVESTLGISVVSLLANKHGIEVTLSAGNPGLTVDVVLPSTVFGPIDVPYGVDGPPPAAAEAPTPAPAPASSDESDAEVEPAAETTPKPAAAAAPVATGLSFDIDPFSVQQPEPTPVVEPEPAAPAAPVATGLSFDIDPFSVQQPEPAAADAPFDSDPDPDVDSDTDTDTDGGGFDLATRRTPAPIDPGFVVEEDRPVAASDWTKMSLSLSAFKSGQESASDAAEEVADSVSSDDTSEYSSFPDLESLDRTPQWATDVADDADVAADTTDDEPDLPTRELVDDPADTESPFDAPTPTDGLARPDLPPPTRVHGEFDVPPAPPIATGGPSLQPVTPTGARQAPLPRVDAPAQPALPTRAPSKGPDGGPDRLAGQQTDTTSSDGEISALENALAAFGDLPSRRAGGSTGTGGSFVDDAPSTTASRLDPNALRERLRAFQTEFKTGADGVDGKYDPNTDLGGDRR